MERVTQILLDLLRIHSAFLYEYGSMEVIEYHNYQRTQTFYTLTNEEGGTFGLRTITIDAKNKITNIAKVWHLTNEEVLQYHSEHPFQLNNS